MDLKWIPPKTHLSKKVFGNSRLWDVYKTVWRRRNQSGGAIDPEILFENANREERLRHRVFKLKLRELYVRVKNFRAEMTSEKWPLAGVKSTNFQRES